MNITEPPPESVASITDEAAERRKRIRRLVILILLISVGIHVVGGIGAGVWVIARYFTQPKAQFVVQKQVQMAPQDREHRMRMEEVSSMRPKPVYNNRIQSLRPSKLVLPELPRVPLETITPIDTDALVTDQVDGMGQHGEGSGGGGFFGGKGAAGSGLLAGGLYDLKRDSQGKETVMNKPAVGKNKDGGVIGDPAAGAAYSDIINKLSRSGSTESFLGKFYKAPDTLYLPQVAIPRIKAAEAPKAFKIEDKVEPRYWVAVYRGRTTAPDTGSYRFLGAADDVLLVKINDRLVFDGSLDNATRLHGKEGLSFSVEKGKAYDIEVILGEKPGGHFYAWLQIQKQAPGEEPYWFRMSDKPVQYRAGKVPEKRINGPIWYPASQKETRGPGL